MTESTRPTKTVICAGGCEGLTGVNCGMCGVAQVIELTDEEISQREADAAAFAAAEAERVAAAEALAVLKASAKAKLISGQPLTAEEADTLVI